MLESYCHFDDEDRVQNQTPYHSSVHPAIFHKIVHNILFENVGFSTSEKKSEALVILCALYLKHYM